MSCVVRFACGQTTTDIRVDAAVNHYLLEAPLVHVGGGPRTFAVWAHNIPVRKLRRLFLASLERDVVDEFDLVDCLLATQDDLCTPHSDMRSIRTDRDVRPAARHGRHS